MWNYRKHVQSGPIIAWSVILQEHSSVCDLTAKCTRLCYWIVWRVKPVILSSDPSQVHSTVRLYTQMFFPLPHTVYSIPLHPLRRNKIKWLFFRENNFSHIFQCYNFFYCVDEFWWIMLYHHYIIWFQYALWCHKIVKYIQNGNQKNYRKIISPKFDPNNLCM